MKNAISCKQNEIILTCHVEITRDVPRNIAKKVYGGRKTLKSAQMADGKTEHQYLTKPSYQRGRTIYFCCEITSHHFIGNRNKHDATVRSCGDAYLCAFYTLPGHDANLVNKIGRAHV